MGGQIGLQRGLLALGLKQGVLCLQHVELGAQPVAIARLRQPETLARGLQRLALLTGLRHGERLAGIAGLSGYLPLAAATATERSEANRDVPLFLAHGTQDPVVMHSRGTASRDALAALGYAIEWHEYPMPHSVCAEEVGDLNRWLLKVLAD